MLLSRHSPVIFQSYILFVCKAVLDEERLNFHENEGAIFTPPCDLTDFVVTDLQ